MQRQRSITRSFSIHGAGVHTGKWCTLTVHPAEVNTGIVFQRLDISGQPCIPAHVTAVESTVRCTRLGNGHCTISTVEHLMAALRGLEIDNCLITIDGPEVPIADGSAAQFATELINAGIVEQGAERKCIELTSPVWVSDGSRHLVALPNPELKISFTFTNDKGHPALSDQYADFIINPDVFRAEIAPARTMGWLTEVEALQKQGLIQGGSIDIAVVIGHDSIITPLRYTNELVRHKILDVIGDLGLLGHLHAHVICIRSGHEMNARLGQAIWKMVTAVDHGVLR